MDLEIAEPADDTSLSRRGVVAGVSAAGLAGIAAALVMNRPAAASTPTTDAQPGIPTDADKVLMEQVIGFELAASDLYAAALESVPEDLAVAIDVMAQNHRAYAQAAAGIAGLSANVVNAEVFDANVAAFTGPSEEMLEAAHTLEQTAVATHTALISEYESADAIALTASIAVVEARQATVIADLLGVDDFDILFGNDQPALELSGADA